MLLVELLALAEGRGQSLALVNVLGRDRGLLYDGEACTIDKLAESLTTDDWEMWSDGALVATNSLHVEIPKDQEYNWAEFGTVYFSRRVVSSLSKFRY